MVVKMKKYKLYDKVLTLGLITIIYGFSLVMLINPDKSFSADENRYLQKAPAFTLEKLISGAYTKEISAWCTDQIPLRNQFVGTKALAESLQLKLQNNNVINCLDRYIIAKNDFVDYNIMKTNLSALEDFKNKQDLPFTLAVAGRSQDVLLKYMPPVYPAKEISDKAFDFLDRLTGGFNNVDLLTPLRNAANEGKYVYYKTDHHYTTLGAYIAYTEIVKSYGIEPYPIDYFEIETASESFYGTIWSKAGMKWIAPDKIEFFRFDGDESLVTEITDTGELLCGLYDRDYLKEKDKYSAFIGGNNGYVRIYPSNDSPLYSENRPKLLMLKDSFGHALAPFLSAHFDLEIVDLRYYRLSVGEIIKAVNPDGILAIYNMDSLISSDSLLNLTING